jgi:hypothetical protein
MDFSFAWRDKRGLIELDLGMIFRLHSDIPEL